MRKGALVFLQLFAAVYLFSSGVYAEEKSGGFVLAFDDGYPSWISTIAPELKRVGGMASGFVNNQRIYKGDLSFEDLRTLQDAYGWEIGTHTYHHHHAPEFVKQKGLAAWLRDELDASFEELKSKGLHIRSMVFPYNDFNEEIAREVTKRFEGFRRNNDFAVAAGKRADGSYPATSLDLGQYVPLDLAVRWIDYASEKNSFLFLYGHKVLPDEEFLTGTVTSVSGKSLSAKRMSGHLADNTDICLVPDISRNISGLPIKVQAIEGDVIKIFRGDLSKLSKPGAVFMAGQCYGMQLSYFRKLIEYAARKMKFYTVHDAIAGNSIVSKNKLSPE